MTSAFHLMPLLPSPLQPSTTLHAVHTSPHHHDIGMAELTERVQALPPELFNQIRDEVIYSQSESNAYSKYRRITAAYHFLTQLHIDKRARQRYAYKYLNHLTFVFTSPELFRKCVLVLAKAGFQQLAHSISSPGTRNMKGPSNVPL